MLKKMLQNLVSKYVIDRLYSMAESLRADGTVQEALKIIDATAASMGILDYKVQVFLPGQHDSARARAVEISKLMQNPLGVTHPDVKIIRINLFRLSLNWRLGRKKKEEILNKVQEVALHEFRHAKQFDWIDSNHPELRKKLFRRYTISAFNWRYWVNPLEKDARRYARTGEHVPFEVVFKDYLK